MTTARAGNLTAIFGVCAEFGADELRVMLLAAQGLAVGRKASGPLGIRGDWRDWRKDASDELLDTSAHLTTEVAEGRFVPLFPPPS
jgi:hypothetical protein